MARKRKKQKLVKILPPDPALAGPDFRDLNSALSYYSQYYTVHTARHWVADWMSISDYSPEEIESYKATDSWHTSITMCAIARLLHQGCPLYGQEEAFLQDRVSAILNIPPMKIDFKDVGYEFRPIF